MPTKKKPTKKPAPMKMPPMGPIDLAMQAMEKSPADKKADKKTMEGKPADRKADKKMIKKGGKK